MTTQAPAGRRRLLPRLNLATMLALVAVVGGSIGWYAYSIRVQRLTVRALRDAGATVLYDWEWDPDDTIFHANGKKLSGWRRSLAERFGPDAVATVAAVSLLKVRGEDKTGLTDEHIALIGRLKSLRGLTLGKLAVAEEGPSPLAGLKDLRTLVINDLWIRANPGPILSQLGEGHRLERLYLQNTVIDDGEDIAAISRLSRLEYLWIVGSGREIGDADLAKLSGLGRLKHLVIATTRITPGGLKSLGGMKSLETISLGESAIDDLAPLLQVPALKWLDLGDCPLGDEGISALAEMPALEHFSMSSSSLTDAGLAQLRGAPALEVLEVRGAPITNAGLESLTAIKTLKRINLSDSWITDREGREFAKAHPGITLRIPRPWFGRLLKADPARARRILLDR